MIFNNFWESKLLCTVNCEFQNVQEYVPEGSKGGKKVSPGIRGKPDEKVSYDNKGYTQEVKKEDKK